MDPLSKEIEPTPLSIEVLSSGRFPLPSYASLGAAGLDLRADLTEGILLQPKEIRLVPTGLRVAIPQGWELQIRARSGMSLHHGVIPLNAPGTIDSDYRGEIQVILANLGEAAFFVEPGMRIAQMILSRYGRVHWCLVESLSSTERGEEGFGSTGKN